MNTLFHKLKIKENKQEASTRLLLICAKLYFVLISCPDNIFIIKGSFYPTLIVWAEIGICLSLLVLTKYQLFFLKNLLICLEVVFIILTAILIPDLSMEIYTPLWICFSIFILSFSQQLVRTKRFATFSFSIFVLAFLFKAVPNHSVARLHLLYSLAICTIISIQSHSLHTINLFKKKKSRYKKELYLTSISEFVAHEISNPLMVLTLTIKKIKRQMPSEKGFFRTESILRKEIERASIAIKRIESVVLDIKEIERREQVPEQDHVKK